MNDVNSADCAKRADEMLNCLDVVLMLSLDVTGYFADELRMRGFYSDRVRSLARELIVQAGGTDFDESVSWLAAVLPDALFSAMQRDCSPQEYGEFTEWYAYRPTQAESNCIFDWESIVSRVCHLWGPEIDTPHPLAGPENAHYRILLRGYNDHRRVVDSEIKRLCDSFLTEWDQYLARKYEEESWGTALSYEFKYLYGKDFWASFGKQADHRVVEELRKWGLEQGIRSTDALWS